MTGSVETPKGRCLTLCGLLQLATPKKPKLRFNIHENSSDKKGIFADFPIYLVLNSAEPFYFDINILANLRGGLSWAHIKNHPAKDTYFIEPEKWPESKNLSLDAWSFYMKMAKSYILGWPWAPAKSGSP